MKRSTLTMTLTAAVAVLALTGCSLESSSPSGDATGSNATSERSSDELVDEPVANAETADGATSSTTAPEPTSEQEGDGTVAFGETATYPSGLLVKISAPEAFTRGEYAVGGEAYSNHVKMSVQVVNKTGTTFDPSLMYMTAQSGNTEGEQIFDTEAGLEGAPMTSLLNGRETTFDVAFGVNDPSDIVLDFSTGDWSDEPTIFTTATK